LGLHEGPGPVGAHFDPALASKHPLSAFALLLGGDVFETVNGRPPADGRNRAQAYLRSVVVEGHGAPPEKLQQVADDVLRLLSGNPQLVSRLGAARPLEIQLIPEGKPMSRYGFPKSSPPDAVGLFWDDPAWKAARIGLRQEHLGKIPQLTVHEMAHAIHFLAFTQEERDMIYRVLLRTYGTRAAVDEAFAVYSEREFLEGFTAHDKRAPHIYGHVRRRWSEEHVFTRFVRYLYFPYKKLAGPPSPLDQR
jgi:hypothetical protein